MQSFDVDPEEDSDWNSTPKGNGTYKFSFFLIYFLFFSLTNLVLNELLWNKPNFYNIQQSKL